MTQPDPPPGVPREARGILLIAFPVTIALWFGLYLLLPPANGMSDPIRRMLIALGWICASALFCLGAGIEAVAHERLQSSSFDPLLGKESRRLIVNQRYLQNTLEQFSLFAPGLAGLACYCDSDAAMRAVPATALVWIATRFAFWIGYHRGSAYRAAGVPGLVIPVVLLLYVTGCLGYGLAGIPGAIAPIAIYLILEVCLFRMTARTPS